MHNPVNTPNPFALDPGEHPFLEATLIQCVASPTMLQWEPGGGGFFAETEAPPTESFDQATLLTQGGKRVGGCAARTFLAFPVVFRTTWEIGEPGSRMRIPSYQDGARSHTQALVMLPSGAWAVVTARGLASQELSGALRYHRYWAARQLRARPFVAAISGIAGQAEKVGPSHVTRFKFVTLEDERCPEEFGQAIRRRWADVCAWRKDGLATNTANPTQAGGPPAGRQPANHPAGLASSTNVRSSPQAVQHYGDGTALGGNRTEQRAFAAYTANLGQAPASRSALRAWWQEQNGGEHTETE